jgi:hypothetical protein
VLFSHGSNKANIFSTQSFRKQHKTSDMLSMGYGEEWDRCMVADAPVGKCVGLRLVKWKSFSVEKFVCYESDP